MPDGFYQVKLELVPIFFICFDGCFCFFLITTSQLILTVRIYLHLVVCFFVP